MAYFYNNYIRKDGMPEITDEQIEEIRMQALMPLKRRRPDVRTYPLINKEAFQKGACPSSRHALEE